MQPPSTASDIFRLASLMVYLITNGNLHQGSQGGGSHYLTKAPLAAREVFRRPHGFAGEDAEHQAGGETSCRGDRGGNFQEQEKG